MFSYKAEFWSVCLTHSFGIPCLGFRIGIDSSADSVAVDDNFDSAWVAVIVIHTYCKIHCLLGLGCCILDNSSLVSSIVFPIFYHIIPLKGRVYYEFRKREGASNWTRPPTFLYIIYCPLYSALLFQI